MFAFELQLLFVSPLKILPLLCSVPLIYFFYFFFLWRYMNTSALYSTNGVLVCLLVACVCKNGFVLWQLQQMCEVRNSNTFRLKRKNGGSEGVNIYVYVCLSMLLYACVYCCYTNTKKYVYTMAMIANNFFRISYFQRTEFANIIVRVGRVLEFFFLLSP